MSVTRERISEKLAARTASKQRAGHTDLDVKLARGGIRDIEFLVQSDETVAYTAIGKNAELASFTGSALTGQSATVVDGSTINTTNTFGLKIVDIGPGPGNAAGDAFTNLVCRWNQNVHPYRNILGV